jgi:hypothetical protein
VKGTRGFFRVIGLVWAVLALLTVLDGRPSWFTWVAAAMAVTSEAFARIAGHYDRREDGPSE